MRKSRTKIPAPKKLKYLCVGGPWGGKYIGLSPGSTSSTMTFSVHKVWTGQYVGITIRKSFLDGFWTEDGQ